MKTQINTERAPIAIGPYSQAIFIDGFLFSSGQIPINPETGNMVEKEIVKQTIQVMENVKAVLKAANLNINNIIKTTIFLKDLKYFDQVNDIYGNYFGNTPPARSCIEVNRLPKDSLIEIEFIAK